MDTRFRSKTPLTFKKRQSLSSATLIVLLILFQLLFTPMKINFVHGSPTVRSLQANQRHAQLIPLHWNQLNANIEVLTHSSFVNCYVLEQSEYNKFLQGVSFTSLYNAFFSRSRTFTTSLPPTTATYLVIQNAESRTITISFEIREGSSSGGGGSGSSSNNSGFIGVLAFIPFIFLSIPFLICFVIVAAVVALVVIVISCLCCKDCCCECCCGVPPKQKHPPQQQQHGGYQQSSKQQFAPHPQQSFTNYNSGTSHHPYYTTANTSFSNHHPYQQQPHYAIPAPPPPPPTLIVENLPQYSNYGGDIPMNTSSYNPEYIASNASFHSEPMEPAYNSRNFSHFQPEASAPPE